MTDTEKAACTLSEIEAHTTIGEITDFLIDLKSRESLRQLDALIKHIEDLAHDYIENNEVDAEYQRQLDLSRA